MTYSLCGDRTPPASPLYSGDESQIRDALADVILAHAATSAAAAAVGEGEGQAAGEQQGLATLAVQLQCLPNIQRLMLEVSVCGQVECLGLSRLSCTLLAARRFNNHSPLNKISHMCHCGVTHHLLLTLLFLLATQLPVSNKHPPSTTPQQQAVQSGALQQDPSAVRAYLSAQLLEVWGRLRWCASARGKLRDVRRLMEVEADTGAASSTRPLLRQVLGKILLQVRPGCVLCQALLLRVFVFVLSFLLPAQ